MKATDLGRFCFRALTGYPLRTGLMLLAMAIGVAAVVLLTALGEGARRYVAGQFTSLGTHLLIVLPGRSETVGGPPPLMGETPRDLTVDDALVLLRSSTIRRVAPIMVGSAPVRHGNRSRDVIVMGSTASLYEVRNLAIARGRFLPEGEADRADAVVVLGHTLKSELFGNTSAVGAFVRIGQRRFRVIGILARQGESLGVDMGDIAIIPVASAQALFNRYSLFRILVQASGRETVARAQQAVLDIIRERHDGEDDVTVITQDAMLATFDRIFQVLTLAVAGIAGISLAVAGILIMNVMLIAVSQRTGEIGLLKALGAPGGQVLRLFLAEAAMLSMVGAVVGLLLAAAGRMGLAHLFPDFPVAVPTWAPIAAAGVAMGTGLVFGVLPARRAARMDPVAALARR
ncbi:ABC transporter permease [Desulfatitalea alkaliphila]|uniref:ABC transporter permease n=1 Tax=Desulfatitalea alkaliphila TaxID=2929485 RepID=A0AA41R797_9BACT|nr:ABC transporter permease [Desulfatitalea alkaliphila]MCJ8502535.1 ABC transporter permease [Desulfatitalea alkaliphila]